MLLFGHLGITVGAFFVLGLLIPRLNTIINPRYLAFGSLLPDIIDKPLGKLFFAYSLANGRTIAHTLLFSLAIPFVGLYRYRKDRDMRPLSLSAGSFCHLVEDQMWEYPATLFWPLYGWEFPGGRAGYTGIEYFIQMIKKSFEPDFSQTFISEMVGLAIMIFFIVNALKSRQ